MLGSIFCIDINTNSDKKGQTKNYIKFNKIKTIFSKFSSVFYLLCRYYNPHIYPLYFNKGSKIRFHTV